MQDPNNPTKPTQPHAHWMGFDGATMATPNANTGDSSLFDFDENKVVSKLPTGALSIAVGMMPDSSKYYVSNYLGHDLSVINMMSLPPSRVGDNISLLLGYNPVSGSTTGTTNDAATAPRAPDPLLDWRIADSDSREPGREICDHREYLGWHHYHPGYGHQPSGEDSCLRSRMPRGELLVRKKVAGTMPMSPVSSPTG